MGKYHLITLCYQSFRCILSFYADSAKEAFDYFLFGFFFGKS